MRQKRTVQFENRRVLVRVLFHQVLTMEKPFDDIDDEDHDSFVFYNHVRPVIPEELPKRTKQMLLRSWAPIIEFRPNMNQICKSLKEDRSEIIQSGTPPSLSTVVAKLDSVALPKSAVGDLLSPSMSYVSSCDLYALSDCNVVTHKKQQKISNKKKNNNNNKNKNNNKVNTIGRSMIPSTIRQMFGGKPQQQLPLDKKNLPLQNHSSGNLEPLIATRAANAKAA